jgi:translation elongation factor EF-G
MVWFFFVSAVGVEPQSETNWRLADQYKYHVLDLLIKWIDKVRTFDGLSTSKRYVESNAVAITLQLVKKMISKVL